MFPRAYRARRCVGMDEAASATHTKTKARTAFGFGFVSLTCHANVPRCIATGMSGVTGGLDDEEVCVCSCHRCDRGLSGCSGGQEEKGGACACVEQRKQQREQLEVRQGLAPDLPAELDDPGLSGGQERA